MIFALLFVEEHDFFACKSYICCLGLWNLGNTFKCEISRDGQLLEECSSSLLLVQTVVLVEVDPSHPVSLGSPRIVSLAAPVTRFGTSSICFPSGPCYQIWHPISIYFLGRLFLRVYFVPRAIESKSNTSFYDPSSSFHCFGFFFSTWWVLSNYLLVAAKSSLLVLCFFEVRLLIKAAWSDKSTEVSVHWFRVPTAWQLKPRYFESCTCRCRHSWDNSSHFCYATNNIWYQ